MEIKNYETLVNEKAIKAEFISYVEKLSVLEWKTKRDLIVERDNNHCLICNSSGTKTEFGQILRERTNEERAIYIQEYNSQLEDVAKSFNLPITQFTHSEKKVPYIKAEKAIILHVHHTYYIKDKLPWDYPNESLKTLCQNCHQDLHNKTEIPVYFDEKMEEKIELTKCKRCNGSGFLSQYDYYLNGICLRCNGNQFDELI